MKNMIAILTLALLTAPLFANAEIRENGGFLAPAAIKINFYSPGDGIDTELYAAVVALIQEYKDAGVVVTYVEKITGMEGETLVCVKLSNLDDSLKLSNRLLALVKAGKNKTHVKHTSSCDEDNNNSGPFRLKK